ncbi:hypothetical protein CPC08DRAFT_724006 [Agrocybe pediades]|nr:hypothetical protein CPC08DRAFT_724006 [Agrocybe pediades]
MSSHACLPIHLLGLQMGRRETRKVGKVRGGNLLGIAGTHTRLERTRDALTDDPPGGAKTRTGGGDFCVLDVESPASRLCPERNTASAGPSHDLLTDLADEGGGNGGRWRGGMNATRREGHDTNRSAYNELDTNRHNIQPSFFLSLSPTNRVNMITMAPVAKLNTPEETLDIEFEDHEEEYPNSFYNYGDGTVPGEPEEYLPRRCVDDSTPPSLPTPGLPLVTALRVDPLLWGGVDTSYDDKFGSNNASPTPSPCHNNKAVELSTSGGGITNGQRAGNEGVVNAADENRGEVPTGKKEDEVDTGSRVRLPQRQPIPRTSLAISTDDWIEGLKEGKGKMARRGYVFDKSKAL